MDSAIDYVPPFPSKTGSIALSQEDRIETTASVTEQPTSTTSRSPFNTLVNTITRTLATTSSTAPTLLRSLTSTMEGYASNPDHWLKYAHSNPNKPYTRNLVFEVPGIFNLLVLVWTPGHGSPIHDHADSHCLMKVLKGVLREQRFEMPNGDRRGSLKEIADVVFEEDKVAYIADTIGLHSVSNPHPTEYAVSLHLYTPPNAAIRGASVYDIESGEGKLVKPSAYDSVQGITQSNE
ncbi:cysteine dioxygenase [Xylogone sp. PMI_703]|nr:cysteine dioxygenase [Xylogone sp. PMI_703]